MFRRSTALKRVIAWLLCLAKNRLERFWAILEALLRRLPTFVPPDRGDSDCLLKDSDDDSVVVHMSCQPSSSRAREKQRTMLPPNNLHQGPASAPTGFNRLPSVTLGWLQHGDDVEYPDRLCDRCNEDILAVNTTIDEGDEQDVQTAQHARKPSNASSQMSGDTSTLLDERASAGCCLTEEDSPNESLQLDPNGDLQIAGLAGQPVVLSNETASPERPKIRTTAPSLLKHYDHNVIIPEYEHGWEIATLMSQSAFGKQTPEHWTSFTHPEGQPYYQAHREGIQYTTEVDITDDSSYGKISRFILEIQDRIRRNGLENASDIEIVLEIEKEEDSESENWTYYVVDHRQMQLRWFERHDIMRHPFQLTGGVPEFRHLKHLMDCEYFLHLSFFPHDRNLSKEFFDKLIGELGWGSIDSMTSLDSHTPYSQEDLGRLLTILQIMRELKDSSAEHAVCAGARLMYVICNERYFNFHGFHGARLTSEQSVRGKRPKKLTGLPRLLSFLLFDVPMKRLNMLDKIYVDQRVQRIQLNVLTNHLVDSWGQEIINAAVLLNANIAFLDLDSVLSNDAGPILSIGAVASIVSTIMTVCSVVIGLLLVKRVRDYKDRDIHVIADILGKWHSEERGLLGLAVMYSVPYALLVWSAIMFVISIACLSFAGRKPSPQVYILAATIVLALLLCAWTVFEIDSFNTLMRKLFPLCFCTQEEAQERRKRVYEFFSKFMHAFKFRPRLPKLELDESTTRNAVQKSPSTKSSQRSKSTEMRALA